MSTLFRLKHILLVSILLAVFLGCGTSTETAKINSDVEGAVDLEIGLDSLSDYANNSHKAKAGTTIEISHGFAIATRDNYPPQHVPLTIENNTATGTIANLATGYWQIEVELGDDAEILFRGSNDVSVKSGSTVGCKILFDPADSLQPGSGSVTITAGINPVPGFKRIDLDVSEIMVSDLNVVVLGTSKQVVVYDSEINRLNDFMLDVQPETACISFDKTTLFFGGDHNIGKMTLIDGVILPDIISALPDQIGIQPISENLLLSWGGLDSNIYIELNNIAGGYSGYHNFSNVKNSIIYNSKMNTLYARTDGIDFPSEIISLRYENPEVGSGNFYNERRTIFNGTYPLDGAFTAVKGGKRLLTAAGDMFIASTDDTLDMTFSRNIGHTAMKIIDDDAQNKIYMITDGPDKKLLVIDDINYQAVATVELPAPPVNFFLTTDSVYVFVEYEAEIFGKKWLKEDILPVP